jgi:peptide/nickel transport system substrate-binding protein
MQLRLVWLVSLVVGISATLAFAQDTRVDRFHPDNQPDASGARPAAPAPLFGGRVIVHLDGMPESLNYLLANSASTRRMLYELHEPLLIQDWEDLSFKPRLSERYVVEDMLVLTAGSAHAATHPAVLDVLVKDRSPQAADDAQVLARVLHGRVEERAEAFSIAPLGPGNELDAVLRVPKDEVLRVERGAVLSFILREDVLWHPTPGFAAHALDAHDVRFTWSLYANPHVDCDGKRYKYEKVTRADVIDERSIRFFYESQYFAAVQTLGVDLMILPAHLYDLSDRDNPAFQADCSAQQQGEFVNANTHNWDWVGLGPYRVTARDQSYIEAQRFEGYFEPDNGGYFDAIRWRVVSDATAMTALLNGELDYFERVSSADYFGAATASADFTKLFYKGYKFLGHYMYLGWNMYRPQLADKVVRTAIAHAFDFEEFKRTAYKDLGNQVTGPFPFNSPAYDHSIEPLAFDPELAAEMLLEGGWYDSNGDGVRDKDGVELEIEFMMPAGNVASRNFGLKLQESLGALGIKLTIAQLEWATLQERLKQREFDAANLGWAPQLESDPEQLWHSKWGAREVTGSNYAGVREARIDALIRAGQMELDQARRQQIWHRIHALIYELQPYLFMYNIAQKYALNRDVRGFQAFAKDPGYSLRRWHYSSLDVPGTRATRAR